jgi:alpha-L-rhamnosidase
MKIINLLCEYYKNPLGIDIFKPRLSWQLSSTSKGAKQTAYQIICESEKRLIWDSGKVKSSQSLHIEYAGENLVSCQRVEWKVRIWDGKNKPSVFSAMAFWEMGLLNRNDWRASWISSSLVGGYRTQTPIPYFVKSFQISKTVVKARLYATALGLYEVSINGKEVTADIFTPGWPDFKRRTLYQTYDVTKLLSKGKNVIGSILGDGWYCGYLAWFNRQFYGDRPKLFSQLMLTYEDGSTEVIVTDNTWKTTTGPILESDIMMGESYDARREIPYWNTSIGDHSKWDNVEIFPDPKILLVGKQGSPVRRIQEIKPVAEPSSKNVFDLGQNFAGRVRLKVSGPAGTTVTLRFAEMLKPDGKLYTENLRTARSTECYTLKGDGEEIYEPRFTFHGFRYIEVKNYPGKLTRNSITGIVIHSDMPETGTFHCSDPLINQLQSNIVWSQKGNFLDIPTDCPQRDERLGWTGDAQAFIRTAAFNMNVAPFFTKWLTDVVYAQAPDGGIPSVIPSLNAKDVDGGPAWADAFVICPWNIYLYYGDTQLLEKMYLPLKKFVDSLDKYSVKGIRANPFWAPPWDGYGDWLSQDSGTMKELLGTAFFAYCSKLMVGIAEATGRKKDSVQYHKLFEKVKKAFNRRFVTEDGLIVDQTQTAYVLALHFDLLPEKLRPKIAEALVNNIKGRGWHLSTGFVGTPYLMHTLSRFGKIEEAYKVLLQKTFPSWLFPVTQGATTIWERWDSWTKEKGFGDVGMNSYNHYAYGAVGDWLYAVVAGIDVDPKNPGYKHIIFRPQPGGELTYAKATLHSMYGAIVSDWKISKNKFSWKVVVPPNTTATIYLPGETKGKVVEAGEYKFTKKWKISH